MTDHFINRVLADGEFDGSASPTTATGPIQVKYSGNPGGMIVNIFHRHSANESFRLIYRFLRPESKKISMANGDQYYAATRGISAATNATLTDA